MWRESLICIVWSYNFHFNWRILKEIHSQKEITVILSFIVLIQLINQIKKNYEESRNRWEELASKLFDSLIILPLFYFYC